MSENKENKKKKSPENSKQELYSLQGLPKKTADSQYIPPTGAPKPSSKPNPEIYSSMGEKNIFRMLEDFYLELEKSKIRFMFPKDMKKASKRIAAFFVFICGGPPMYQQNYGEPRLRERHLPFPIDETARKEWLRCFDRILEHSKEQYSFPGEHLESFRKFLQDFSVWMVNIKEK